MDDITETERPSLPRSLWQLAILLCRLATPLVLPTVFGFPIALAVLLALVLAECIQSRMRGSVNRKLPNFAALWTIGLGFAAFATLDGWLAIAGALAIWICGLILHGVVRGMLVIARLKQGSSTPPGSKSPMSDYESNALSGTSGVYGAPARDPEGGAIEVIGIGEIGMGGPMVIDYMLADGAILKGGGPGACFSEDGRYFLSPMPDPNAYRYMIYDRSARMLHRLPAREVPADVASASDSTMDALKACSSTQAMVAMQDLLVPQEDFADALKILTTPRFLRARGRPQLDYTPWLPARLRELPQPLQHLDRPLVRLAIAGRDSGLLLKAHHEPVWASDNRTFACSARTVDDPEFAYWLCPGDARPRRLGTARTPAKDEPGLFSAELRALEHQALWLATELEHPELSQPQRGRLEDHTSYPITIVDSHAADGRGQSIELPAQQVELSLPVGDDVAQTTATWRSPALIDGQVLEWRWLRNDADERRATYACRLGDWELPGEWALDFRVDDAGARIALVAHETATQLRHRVAIIDVTAQRLEWLPDSLPCVELQGFAGDRLHLVHISGLLDVAPSIRPGKGPMDDLDRQEHPLPPHAIRDGLALPAELTTSYSQAAFDRHGDHWVRLPRTRKVTCCQAAEAEGDYWLPSPDGSDAVYGFGFETSYPFKGDDEPRRKGLIITASGCCIADLAPPALWSGDGRFLALSRLVRQGADPQADTEQWRLLLLDCRERTLRTYAEPLGERPRFERFDRDLQVISGKPDKRESSVWRLRDLLAVSPKPLTPIDNNRCVTPDQHSRRDAWARLELPARTT